MHKNESKVNLTLTNHAINKYELERELLGPIGKYWLPLESNFEVDSTFQYKDTKCLSLLLSITFSLPMNWRL